MEFLFLLEEEDEVAVVFLLGLLRLLLLLLLLLLFFDFLDFLTVFDVLLLLLLLTLEGLEFGLVVLGDDDDAADVDVLFSKLTFVLLFLDDNDF